MIRFVFTAIVTGLLFALMDGLINANPYSIKLMDAYSPIAKQSVNFPLAFVIDLYYGFTITSVFIIIRPALPAGKGITRGLLYGLGIWFFRVFMSVTSNWIMFNIPPVTLIYILLTGLIEMVLLGILNGIMLNQKNAYA